MALRLLPVTLPCTHGGDPSPGKGPGLSSSQHGGVLPAVSASVPVSWATFRKIWGWEGAGIKRGQQHPPPQQGKPLWQSSREGGHPGNPPARLLWVPLPGWCRRCRSWRCPVPPGGHPARGTGPRRPRPWPRCRAGQRAPRAQCPPPSGSQVPASGSALTAGPHLGGQGGLETQSRSWWPAQCPGPQSGGLWGGGAGGRRAGSLFCPSSTGGPRGGSRAGVGLSAPTGPAGRREEHSGG